MKNANENFFQCPLFPTNSNSTFSSHMLNVLEMFESPLGYGSVNMVLEFFISNRVVYHSILSMSPELAAKLRYKIWHNGRVQIENQEILLEAGVDIPVNEYGSIARITPIFESVSKARLIEQANTPTRIGWWDTDFSGYGSEIDDPFTVQINENWTKAHIREIGYMAKDIVNGERDRINPVDIVFSMKFVNDRLLPVLMGKTLVIGDGAYRGRPLGIKKGIENVREITVTSINDLMDCAGLGTVLLEIK